MALVNQTLKLEITPGVLPPKLHVTEYDENMQVVAQLLQRGQYYEIPSGTTAKVEGNLAGHPFIADATVHGSSVTFELTKSMTAYAGRAWTKIKLTKDGKSVSTCGFWLECDRAGVEAETVIGADGFQEQINQAVAEYIEDVGLIIDSTLSRQGAAADAKATGDAISKLSEDKVNPVTKTADMTQPVGVDGNGLLWTAPTSNDSGDSGSTKNDGIWVILGDSISVSTGYTSKFYYDFIKDDLGLTPEILAVGGQGYRSGEGSRFYETQCPNIPDDYAVLTIMGGTNDNVKTTVDGSVVDITGEVTDTTADTFYGALYLTLIEGIQAKHPEKPLGVIIPIPRNNSDYYRARCNEVCEALVTFCEYYNIPYLDLHKQGGVNPYVESIAAVQYASDKIHLNDFGQEIIARRIKTFVSMLASVGSGESEDSSVTYTVTNSLTNVANNNGASSVAENAAYTATLTADSGYILDSVTVTMGGVDITSTAYNNGVVSISAVTGNVVITAEAVESKPAENIFDKNTMVLYGNIDPNGTLSSSTTKQYVKIPVTGGTKYNVYHGGNFASFIGVAQWDESDTVIVWLANGSVAGNDFRQPDQTVITQPGIVHDSGKTAFTFTAEPTAKYLVFNTNDALTEVLEVTTTA